MISEFKDKTIGILCGGVSREKSVSLRSGKNVAAALERMGYICQLIDIETQQDWVNKIDVAFIALHGFFGEDGCIQSYLEIHGIPYTGSRVLGSVISMNKLLTKQLLLEANIPVANYIVQQQPLSELPLGINFPVMVKPTSGGSSIDVYLVDTNVELTTYTTQLSNRYDCYLLEEFLEGKEITVGILDGLGTYDLPILELRPKNRFYDYEAKYQAGGTQFVLPATIGPEQTKYCQEIALKAHQTCQCRGMSRVDMIFNPERGPFVLEVNGVPGLTDLSDLPAQAAKVGISFDRLIEMILHTAVL